MPRTLTSQETDQYFESERGKARPLSPLDWRTLQGIKGQQPSAGGTAGGSVGQLGTPGAAAPTGGAQGFGSVAGDFESAFGNLGFDQPSTIMETYEKRRQLAQEQSGGFQDQVQSEFASQKGDIEEEAELERTKRASTLRGLGPATMFAILDKFDKGTEKRINTLAKQRDDALAQNRMDTAERLDNLLAQEQESITQARTQALNTFFNLRQEERDTASFETPQQAQQRTLQGVQQQSVLELAQTAPDAGILPTDDYATAISKYRNSGTYSRDVRAAEAQIANLESQATARLSDIEGGDVSGPSAYGAQLASHALDAITQITGLNPDLERVGSSQISPWTTGAAGQLSSWLGGTPARDLRANLDQLQAALGFDQLNQMREASKTGGALGQVTEREIALLQSVVASTDQYQSDEQLLANMNRVRNHLTAIHTNFQKQAQGVTSADAAVTADDIAEMETNRQNAASGNSSEGLDPAKMAIFDEIVGTSPSSTARNLQQDQQGSNESRFTPSDLLRYISSGTRTLFPR